MNMSMSYKMFESVEISQKFLALYGMKPEKTPSKFQTCLFLFLTIFPTLNSLLALTCVNMQRGLITNPDTQLAVTVLVLSVHGLVKSINIAIKKSLIFDLLQNVHKHFWTIEEIDDQDKDDVTNQLKSLKQFIIFFCAFPIVSLSPMGLNAVLGRDDDYFLTCYKPDWIPLRLYYLLLYVTFVPITCMVITANDILIMTLMKLTRIQFQILGTKILKLFNLRNIKFEKEFQNELKKCVEHHAFLLEHCEKINKVYSEVLFIYMILLICSMCYAVFLAMIVKSPALIYRSVGYCVWTLGILWFAYCSPAQSLIDEADDIALKAYKSDWYKDLIKAKAVQMIIRRTQRHMRIRAARFWIINMETWMNTVQRIFSYSMALRTLGGYD